MIKKIVRISLTIIGTLFMILVLAIVAFLGVAAILEYRPDDIERIAITGDAKRDIKAGDSLTIVTFNIGYGGLSADQDFFMDGGTIVRPDDQSVIEKNMTGILKILSDIPADIYLLQEVDLDSKRSYHINQAEQFITEMQMNAAFAHNFNSIYTPFPIPPIGKVESGLLTLTNLEINEAKRVSLPVPFSWPVRIFNLKRCLLAEHIPVGEKELVLVNLHLEAYDEGEGNKEQFAVLMDILLEEYENGNYVIAGGDFNQIFPGAAYPEVYPEYWQPGEFDESLLPEGWQLAFDAGTPTCRLLNKPFSGDYDDTQLYVIDGYILSPNVKLDFIKTVDAAFEYSDHNPVLLRVTL